MVGVRVNDTNAQQLFKFLSVLKDIRISRDKSSTLALVRGINMKRIPSVVWANDLHYSFQHLRSAEVTVCAVELTVGQI